MSGSFSHVKEKWGGGLQALMIRLPLSCLSVSAHRGQAKDAFLFRGYPWENRFTNWIRALCFSFLAWSPLVTRILIVPR